MAFASVYAWLEPRLDAAVNAMQSMQINRLASTAQVR